MSGKRKSTSSRNVNIYDGDKRRKYGRDAARNKVDQDALKWQQTWTVLPQADKDTFAAIELSAAGLAPDAVLHPCSDWIDDPLDDVLEGREVLDLSHEGGELAGLVENIHGDLLRLNRHTKRYRDTRTRRDRTERRTRLFRSQMPDLVVALAHWEATRGDEGHNSMLIDEPEGILQGTMRVMVVDLFSTYAADIELYSTDQNVSAAFVRNGLLPCAPINPTVAVTIRTMELYRRTQLRCPRLSMQAFARSLSDTHNMPTKKYFAQQLVICNDLLLAMREGVDAQVLKALGRDSPNWRLVNACPCCMYRVENEPRLAISMIFSMDGNNSLSRCKGFKASSPDADPDAAKDRNERIDTRDGRGTYILSKADVDRWAHDAFANKWEGAGPDETGCEDRWQNMINDISSKMWGIYEETGLFLAVCRHGVVLLATDMIESGELAKYPLAIINRLLEIMADETMNITWRDDMKCGYDVGCKFNKTIGKLELGPEARRKNLTCCVGLFHGHAHGRLCQLHHLGTYIPGMGIEDCETCERFFSRSNALASVIRHASTFRRHQTIVHYFKHVDENETFQNLSHFLYNNVKQSIEILATRPALIRTMGDLEIENTGVFHTWLHEERAYLSGLKKEPEEETLSTEYYRALLMLDELTQKRAETLDVSMVVDGPASLDLPDHTLKTETLRRHAIERHALKLEEVMVLEDKIGIEQRWQRGSLEWQDAAKLYISRKYRRALDKLEGLVVARIFELTKMNMSQTGYKLRKHIAKALQTRSKAVKNALEQYNSAAAELRPPRRALGWEEVVTYGFLAEFDVLRGTERDSLNKGWATEAGRQAMDQYFKTCRADEELVRCEVESKRLLTYMQDEEEHLAAAVEVLEGVQPDIAFAISKRLLFRSRLHDEHRARLSRMDRLVGCPFTAEIGKRAGKRKGFEREDITAPTVDGDAPPDPPPASSPTPMEDADNDGPTTAATDPLPVALEDGARVSLEAPTLDPRPLEAPALDVSSPTVDAPAIDEHDDVDSFGPPDSDSEGDVDGEFDWDDGWEGEGASSVETAIAIADIARDGGMSSRLDY